MKTTAYDANVEGDTILIRRHYVDEVRVDIDEAPERFKEQGYVKYIYGSHGYGHLLHKSGRWDYWDVMENNLLKEDHNPFADDELFWRITSEDEGCLWVEKGVRIMNKARSHKVVA